MFEKFDRFLRRPSDRLPNSDWKIAMYLNDPILYGATLPYADVPVHTFPTPFVNQFVPPYTTPWQTPWQHFTPWQTLAPWQRLLPGIGFTPYQQLHAQQIPMQQIPMQQLPIQQLPMLHQFNPYMHGAAFNPFFGGYNFNLPFCGWQRPGIF